MEPVTQVTRRERIFPSRRGEDAGGTRRDVTLGPRAPGDLQGMKSKVVTFPRRE